MGALGRHILVEFIGCEPEIMNDVIKILIADDDPDVLFATTRVLTSCGYEVIEATTGAECIEINGAFILPVSGEVNAELVRRVRSRVETPPQHQHQQNRHECDDLPDLYAYIE